MIFQTDCLVTYKTRFLLYAHMGSLPLSPETSNIILYLKQQSTQAHKLTSYISYIIFYMLFAVVYILYVGIYLQFYIILFHTSIPTDWSNLINAKPTRYRYIYKIHHRKVDHVFVYRNNLHRNLYTYLIFIIYVYMFCCCLFYILLSFLYILTNGQQIE